MMLSTFGRVLTKAIKALGTRAVATSNRVTLRVDVGTAKTSLDAEWNKIATSLHPEVLKRVTHYFANRDYPRPRCYIVVFDVVQTSAP